MKTKTKQKSHIRKKTPVILECPQPSLTKRRVSPSLFVAVFAGIGLVLALIIIESARSLPQVPYTPLVRRPTQTERVVRSLTAGFPIEHMAQHIGRTDPKTAAFLVGVAKKESNWGKRVPHKDGADCYNYWGYRGISDNMTESGYTCFATPREAIATVGGRMRELIHEYRLDTPREFVVWKCGYSCAGHAPGAVEKWIADVGIYVGKMETLTQKTK